MCESEKTTCMYLIEFIGRHKVLLNIKWYKTHVAKRKVCNTSVFTSESFATKGLYII